MILKDSGKIHYRETISQAPIEPIPRNKKLPQIGSSLIHTKIKWGKRKAYANLQYSVTIAQGSPIPGTGPQPTPGTRPHKWVKPHSRMYGMWHCVKLCLSVSAEKPLFMELVSGTQNIGDCCYSCSNKIKIALRPIWHFFFGLVCLKGLNLK